MFLTATEIPQNESNETTATAASHVTDHNSSSTIPEIISLDPLEVWSAKLNLFIERYLMPAYERGVALKEQQSSAQAISDKFSLSLTSPEDSVFI